MAANRRTAVLLFVQLLLKHDIVPIQGVLLALLAPQKLGQALLCSSVFRLVKEATPHRSVGCQISLIVNRVSEWGDEAACHSRWHRINVRRPLLVATALGQLLEHAILVALRFVVELGVEQIGQLLVLLFQLVDDRLLVATFVEECCCVGLKLTIHRVGRV